MELELRIKRLEQSQLRWRLLACVLGLVILAVVVIGEASAVQRQLLQAGGLIIQDGQGRNRITVMSESMHFYDQNGKMRINLHTNNEGQAFIRLYDSMNREKFSLGVGPAGHSVMNYVKVDGSTVQLHRNY